MSFAPFDDDFDNLIDYDQGFHTAGELNSHSSFDASGSMDPIQSMYSFDPTERRQVFSGPSHEYGRFRQLTGLPTGAMTAIPMDAEIKLETPYSMMPSPAQSMPFMDFNNFSFDQEIDPMQQESVPAFFFPNNTFVDSNNMSSDAFISAPSQAPQPSRLYPGMHSQQAQQARAQALARQQSQQQLGQEIMQQRHRQSVADSVVSMPTTRANSVGSVVGDSGVDDKLSRLLDHMRNNSNMETIDEEEDSSSGGNGKSGRSRKDEDDMDEDERLLNSEEGKKLSSKERRQLRNKVSARAFRSRRKGMFGVADSLKVYANFALEYIGQLEGEVAEKTRECDQLKAQNRHQAEQIAQLTQLTRSLLAHPAFATFAEDLSNDPSLLASTSSSSSGSSTPKQTESKQQTQNKTKTQPKQEPQQPEQLQVNRMQQDSLDLSMLNLGSAHWNASTAFNFQPSVFAVLELPQPAEFSARTLSGKNKGDELSQILSPFKLLPSMPAAKTQQPRLFTAKTSQDIEVKQVRIGLTSTATPCSDHYTEHAIRDIEAAFDEFETQIKQLSTLLGQSPCRQ